MLGLFENLFREPPIEHRDPYDLELENVELRKALYQFKIEYFEMAGKYRELLDKMR
ncbi:TPA: hypothetical protein U1C44_001479 [Streptococcus suis]|nr:hypothetical protein [Streptococcus suis]